MPPEGHDERWEDFIRRVSSTQPIFDDIHLENLTKTVDDFAEQMRQAEERMRQRNDFWEEYFNAFAHRFDQAYQTYSGTNTTGNGYYTRGGHRVEFKTSAPTPGHALAQLAKLAGVEDVPNEPKAIKSAYRRAQRKCHPDTGGSHELWLKLQKLEYLIR